MVDSKLLAIALAVVDGYNKWDMDAIMAPRAENCTQRVYPFRLNRPYRNNIVYREYFENLLPYFDGFTVTIIDTFVDEGNNSVAVHARSKASTFLGPYANEYSLMMKMTESQDEVWEIKEFVDSEYSADFFAKLSQYIERGGPGIHSRK